MYIHSKYVAPDVLEVMGVRCTSVQRVSATASTELDKALLTVSKWLEDLSKTDAYVNETIMIEAFALTLCMNCTCERHPTNRFLSVSEFIHLLQKIVFLDDDVNNGLIYSDREIANMIQKIGDRVLFITDDRNIGLPPFDIQSDE